MIKTTFLSIQTLFLSSFVSITEALAQAPAAAPAAGAPGPVPPPSFGETLFSMLPMIAICYLVFYFMVIKPQAAKLKNQQDLLTGLKRGDTVVTTSGIVGKVAGNEKDYILVEISQGVKVKFEPGHITKKVQDEVKSSEAA